MSHIIKPSSTDSQQLRLTVAIAGALIMLFILIGFTAPKPVDALSVNGVTNSVTKVLTMGKSTAAPVYTPAASNAPAGAITSAAAATPATTSTTSVTAQSAGQTATPTNTAATSQAAGAATGSTTQSAGQTNLYKVTQLTASQHRLVKKLLQISLLVGGSLLALAALALASQWLAAHGRAKTTARKATS